MRARSDSSAARGMTQRQGIGRVRDLNASMLWIQQKEREKALSVAAIPTDLNSADVGAKNLPKKRLRGLQYMLHLVDSVGDRVGEQEFREIEEEHQLRQGMKKFGKNKDLRIGLLMLLTTINQVGSTATEVKEKDETDWIWMMLCSLACVGALSLASWLRSYTAEFLDGTKAFIKENVEATMQFRKLNMKVQIERVDQETQVSVPDGRRESELEEVWHQCFLKDRYIEELEQDLKEVRARVADFLQEREIAEKHSSKLEERMRRLKMTSAGRVLHFAGGCPDYRQGQPIRLCHVCLGEGGVTDSSAST